MLCKCRTGGSHSIRLSIADAERQRSGVEQPQRLHCGLAQELQHTTTHCVVRMLLLLLLPGVFGRPAQAGRQAASGGPCSTGETPSCSLAAAAYTLQILTAIRRNCW
jgi:hypothetical protein